MSPVGRGRVGVSPAPGTALSPRTEYGAELRSGRPGPGLGAVTTWVGWLSRG